MNEENRDSELKSLVEEWKVPSPAVDFHSRVLSAFEREFGHTPWWKRRLRTFALGPRLFAVALSAVVLLLVIGQAFPQSLTLFSPGFRIPYVVEYEFIRYSDDGSPVFEARLTSFKNGGDQIILSETDSATSPFLNAVRGIANSARMVVLQLAPALILPPESSESIARNRAYVRNGCLGHGETVIGHETVLGHSTTVVQFNSADQGRTIQWLAPGLDCFALKHTNEEQRPDGSYRIVLRQQALKVTVNQ